MSTRRPSLSCAHLMAIAFVCACGCTMEQDLGRSEGVGNAGDPNQQLVDDTHSGFGAGWACPADGQTIIPGARDLACPLSLPIEGDACPFASSAPCAFESSEKGRAVCICTSDHRWSCLSDIFFRPLRVAPVEGEACFAPVEVAKPCGDGATDCEITCRCVNDAYRCNK